MYQVAITYGDHDAEDELERRRSQQLEKVLKVRVEKKNSSIVEDRECYTIEIYDPTDSELGDMFYIM